jgi:Rrf2 family nitric oxide-sensitive transcriptional repressor
MQLSLHADYSLRVLIYLGTHPERVVSTKEISAAYGISKNHLVRVVQTLGQSGYVRIAPGRGGGVILARNIHEIRLGEVVRATEPDLTLVECFDKKTNTCPIARSCALKHFLNAALDAFLVKLNEHTLADILAGGNSAKLIRILGIPRS